ncbi:MAG: CBS domain-containing protein [Woeseiaceae bacterium]|nr:CBS domain-containing protein [Woeseiaceae bacterium]
MNKPERISVRKAMREDVTFIDGRKNVLDALRAMRDGQCTSLVVEKRDDHDEYGILTLSDIAKQVIAKDRAPERVHVFEIMTKPCVSVHPDMDIRYCARLFREFGIRRAPVVHEHKVIGMISYYHLVLEALPDLD